MAKKDANKVEESSEKKEPVVGFVHSPGLVELFQQLKIMYVASQLCCKHNNWMTIDTPKTKSNATFN